MPQFNSYPLRSVIAASDKILACESSTGEVFAITFSNFLAAITGSSQAPEQFSEAGAVNTIFLSNVTKLEGTDDTALSNIPTADLDVNTYAVLVYIDGALQTWMLQAGTSATGPGIQRPNDYNVSTNEKIWVIQS